MKVLFLNTFKKYGGASIASNRLINALSALIEVNLIYLFETRTDNKIKFFFNFLSVIIEKILLKRKLKNKGDLFNFSLSLFSITSTNRIVKQKPDIIHLHWINLGLLSIGKIKKIQTLKTPIVWTLHDMWVFTGGCHYAGDCLNYLDCCGDCKYLKKTKNKDLSHKLFVLKQKKIDFSNITFITCSNWLAECASQSALLKNCKIVTIPNAIDRNIFKPIDKEKVRKKLKLNNHKKYVLFAVGDINDNRKGFSFLIDAFGKIADQYKLFLNEIEILLLGNSENIIQEVFPVKVNRLGYINDTDSIVDIYNAADIFVLPSVDDNLPNTIMEAMACAVPCLAYNSGGIPEMIQHKKNGYLAELKSTDDLADGLIWILNNEPPVLGLSALNFVINNYDAKMIAQKHNDLYSSII